MSQKSRNVFFEEKKAPAGAHKVAKSLILQKENHDFAEGESSCCTRRINSISSKFENWVCTQIIDIWWKNTCSEALFWWKHEMISRTIRSFCPRRIGEVQENWSSFPKIPGSPFFGEKKNLRERPRPLKKCFAPREYTLSHLSWHGILENQACHLTPSHHTLGNQSTID